MQYTIRFKDASGTRCRFREWATTPEEALAKVQEPMTEVDVTASFRPCPNQPLPSDRGSQDHETNHPNHRPDRRRRHPRYPV